MTPRAALAIIVLGGLAIVSLGPFPQPDLPGPLELLPHALAYAAVTYVLLVVTHRDAPVRPWMVALIAASMVMLGVALELAQRVVDRDVDVDDAIANTLGVGLAVVVWTVFRLIRNSGPSRGR